MSPCSLPFSNYGELRNGRKLICRSLHIFPTSRVFGGVPILGRPHGIFIKILISCQKTRVSRYHAAFIAQ